MRQTETNSRKIRFISVMGWDEAADYINKGIEGAIADKTVTYDFARLMNDAKEVSCSGFGEAIIKHM